MNAAAVFIIVTFLDQKYFLLIVLKSQNKITVDPER